MSSASAARRSARRTPRSPLDTLPARRVLTGVPDSNVGSEQLRSRPRWNHSGSHGQRPCFVKPSIDTGDKLKSWHPMF